MKRIAWVIKRPYSARDADRLGVSVALERGYQCLVIDGSDALHPEARNPLPHESPTGAWEVRRPKSMDSLLGEIRALDDLDLVIATPTAMGLTSLYLSTMRAISCLDVPYLATAPYPSPTYLEASALTEAGGFARYALQRMAAVQPLTSILARLPPGMCGIRPADFVLYCSLKSETYRNNLVAPRTLRICSHTPDYDVILRGDYRNRPVKNQAMFIDQYAPFHPDMMLPGVKPMDAQSYYAQLNSVFDLAERKFGMEVVIAVHPRADYSDKPWAYAGRRIVKGQTIALIAESRMVLAHHSVALNAAVALRKPVTLLASRDLMELYPIGLSVLHGFSHELKLPLNRMDGDLSAIRFTENLSDQALEYEAFEQMYLRHPLDDGTAQWDKVFDMVFRDRQSAIKPQTAS